MIVFEALKAVVNYPLSESAVRVALIRRGLNESDGFSQANALSKEFELASADLYLHLATSANIQEGDYNLSVTDKSNFLKMASAIYKKWDEPDLTESKPAIRNLSDRW